MKWWFRTLVHFSDNGSFNGTVVLGCCLDDIFFSKIVEFSGSFVERGWVMTASWEAFCVNTSRCAPLVLGPSSWSTVSPPVQAKNGDGQPIAYMASSAPQVTAMARALPGSGDTSLNGSSELPEAGLSDNILTWNLLESIIRTLSIDTTNLFL